MTSDQTYAVSDRTRRQSRRRRPRKSRGDRRRVFLSYGTDTTTLTDLRIGRVTVPGLWKTITECRLAIDRLPMSVIVDEYWD